MPPQNTDAPADILPGRKPVREMLATDPSRIQTVYLKRGNRNADSDAILDACREHNIRFKLTGPRELDAVFRGNHQGVVAVLAAAPMATLDTVIDAIADAPLPLVLVLDQVQDTGNVGAMARTLYALGGAGIIVPKDRSARLGSGALKASAGALAHLPVAQVTNLGRAIDALNKAAVTTLAIHDHPNAIPLPDASLRLPVALVLGNEEKGIRPSIADKCAHHVRIPLARSFDSLNVAQAGAILMAACAKVL